MICARTRNYLPQMGPKKALHGLTYFARILYLWQPAKVAFGTLSPFYSFDIEFAEGSTLLWLLLRNESSTLSPNN